MYRSYTKRIDRKNPLDLKWCKFIFYKHVVIISCLLLLYRNFINMYSFCRECPCRCVYAWTKEGEIWLKASIYLLCVNACVLVKPRLLVLLCLLSVYLCVFICGMCMSRSRRHTVIVADALYSVSLEDVSGMCGSGVDFWLCAKDSWANRLSEFPAKISSAVRSVLAKALLLMRVRKDGGERRWCYGSVCVCGSVCVSAMCTWCGV